MPAADGIAVGAKIAAGLPSSEMRAAIRPQHAENRKREFGAPGAEQAGQADAFRRADGQRNVLDTRRRASDRRPAARPAQPLSLGCARTGRRSCRSSVRSGATGSCPAVGKTPTSLPSRSTVTRLEMSSTSASRWLTKTTAMPSAESVRTMASRWSVSDWVSEAVGSSMKMSFASPTSARAMATICRCAIAKVRSGASTSRSTPSRASSRSRALAHARHGSRAAAARRAPFGSRYSRRPSFRETAPGPAR